MALCSVSAQSPGSMSDALVLLLAGEAPRAGEPLVLHDGMHLLDPLAEHHRILAMEGTGSRSPGAVSNFHCCSY